MLQGIKEKPEVMGPAPEIQKDPAIQLTVLLPTSRQNLTPNRLFDTALQYNLRLHLAPLLAR